MKKLTKMFVGVFIAVLLATSAIAATNTTNTVSTAAPEAWTLTLGGVGSTTTSGNSQSAFGVDVSVGHTGHLVLPLEAGVRQSVSYASPNGGSTVLSTKLYSDWTLLKVSKLDIFAGGNVGLAYGNQPLVWTAAPEVGTRLWLKKDVAVVGRVEYPFNLNDGKSGNTLLYSVGVLVKF